MSKQLIKYDATINVPPGVAICPYCLTGLAFTGAEWEHNDDGTVSVSSIELECLAGEEHDYNLPYVHWLPICERVKTWANEHYDFDLVDWDERLKKWREVIK